MKWTSNKKVHDVQPWTKTYNEHSVLFHLGRTARHTLYDWHEASTLKPLPCQFNKHSLLVTIIIFITPTFSCVYHYHHSAFDCHDALILKHLLSIFIFDVQYSHNHNDIGYSRSLLFKPIILFYWTTGGRYPIWFNSIFEFCQKKLFIQYLVQYCFTQDSIQNIIQLKKINSKVSKKTKKGAFHKKWQI